MKKVILLFALFSGMYLASCTTTSDEKAETMEEAEGNKYDQVQPPVSNDPTDTVVGDETYGKTNQPNTRGDSEDSLSAQ